MTQKLSDFGGTRANNFTLLRLAFALTVLWSHSFAISGAGWDPISSAMHPYFALQELAVDGFFIISGFLVTPSLVNRGPFGYALRRAVRIFPGYLMCLAITVLILGPLLTTLPAAQYFSHHLVISVLHRGWYIWNGTQGALPGVFLHNPRPQIMNDSLWTLTPEIRSYGALLVLGLAGIFSRRATANFALFCLLAIAVFNYPALPVFGDHARWGRLPICFMIGVLIWVNRASIPINPKFAALAVVVPFVFVPLGREAVIAVSYLAFAYLIFFVAYGIRHIDLDRFGDLSYGIYIYAWPVQQIVVMALPNAGGYRTAFLSALSVLPIAALSWFFVERPATRLVRRWPDISASLRHSAP